MTNTTPGAAEPLTITITRWEGRGRPGTRPSTNYGYITPVEIRIPAGDMGIPEHVTPAGAEVTSGDSYLDDIRSRLKRKLGRKTTFLKSWEPATCSRCQAPMAFRGLVWVPSARGAAAVCGPAGQAHVPSQPKAAR